MTMTSGASAEPWMASTAAARAQRVGGVGEARRHVQRKGRSLRQFAAHTDIAAQQLGQSARDGEAKAGAAILLGDRRIGLHERLEEPRELFARHADAGVAHGDEKLFDAVARFALEGDLDVAVARELAGV